MTYQINSNHQNLPVVAIEVNPKNMNNWNERLTNSDQYEYTNCQFSFSLAIVYAVFTVANWIAPSAVAMIGPRATMIIGALAYVGFIAQLLILNEWLLYLMSALLGIGAALIWTAQVLEFNLKTLLEKESGQFSPKN